MAYVESRTFAQVENQVNELTEFTDELDDKNYQDHFHTLLHLEEIEYIRQLRLFDCNEAILRQDEKLWMYSLKDEAHQNFNFLSLGKDWMIRY